MRTVYKYSLGSVLSLNDYMSISLPKGALICKVGIQRSGVSENLWIWALIDTNVNDSVQRVFRIAGTGHPIEEESLEYYNTIFVENLVFHIFEVINADTSI